MSRERPPVLPPVDLAVEPPYNPDRVRTEATEETVTTVTPPVDRYETRTVRRAIDIPASWYGQFSWRFERVRRVLLAALVGSAIGTAATNVDNELERGTKTDELTNKEAVKQALNTTDMETLVKETEKKVCEMVDYDFMDRFSMTDADGNETFNPGAVVLPFAVELKENCKAKVDVEIHIPYHFARTFNEIVAKNPGAREEMVKKLAQFITSEAQNQLVIKGIAGVTDTTYVYNKHENILAAGKPIVDLGRFDVSNIKLEGAASGEAELSGMNAEAESLKGFNPENTRLAGKRLEDVKPLIMDALRVAGVDPAVLAKVKSFSYEHNLVDTELGELARISEKVLGGVVSGSDEQTAYALVKEINAGNPAVMAAINADPQSAATLEKHLLSKRSVNISFEAETEYGKTTVYNISVLLPLGVLLLPYIRFTRVPGGVRIIEEEARIRIPDRVDEVTERTVTPEARRLFSETTPGHLDEQRDFNAVYDSIDLSARAQDTHNLLQHMLIEEVLPSLYEQTSEPLIDYEYIVNACREFLASDARRDSVKKGHYATPDEAQRKMTEQLIDMWERHDVATYPMQGIDIKTVLNYRHSEYVVYWAKTLAYELTRLAEQTDTTDELRNALIGAAEEAARSRAGQGNSDRNQFVVSNFPEGDAS